MLLQQAAPFSGFLQKQEWPSEHGSNQEGASFAAKT